MKRWLLFLFLIALFIPCAAVSESAGNWADAPVLVQAYEIAAGKLYIEWTGNAPVYQVYLDGECVESVIINNATISLKAGTHAIVVYPINESKNADTRLELGLNASVIGASIDFDLAALGLDPKNLTAGHPSNTLNIDYTPSSIFKSAPEDVIAFTDSLDRVHLSFTDRYYADEYTVSIKVGKDISHISFTKGDTDAEALIQQTKSTVTLILDPKFLEAHECMVPELNNKYIFTVQLRKYAENMLNNELNTAVIHQSKESDKYTYTPTAAWKTTPIITYSSQTADGQITLQWEHEDYNLGCEYIISKQNKTLGLTTSSEELGRTSNTTYTINDLMNGDYSLVITPALGSETGSPSAETTVNIQNDWVVAPLLNCNEISSGSVRLSWFAEDGIENYHIIVYKGDNDSILRFINMDYSGYAQYELSATGGEMEYIFNYEAPIDPAIGERFKFEIYGTRHTQNGVLQTTAVTTSSLVIGIIAE